jgi:exosortase K
MRRYRLKRLRPCCPSPFERGDEGRGFGALNPHPNRLPRGEEVKNLNWNRNAQLVVVLLCGIALKYFYSTASVNELRWILAPTTFLVELITGAKFQFESHAGYMNSDHTFLIAASCAGVNFLLTAFLMLALGRLWRNRSQKIAWTFIPMSVLIAYAATLVANTVRISTALRLHRLPPEIGWLTPDQLHRFEGIFIYFGFLLLLFVASEWFGSRTNDIKPQPVRSSPNSFGLVWRVLFPLVIYYTTTLGIPLVNGAYRQGADFWEHSLFVVLTPLIVVLPFVTFKLIKSLSFETQSTEISLSESARKSAMNLS